MIGSIRKLTIMVSALLLWGPALFAQSEAAVGIPGVTTDTANETLVVPEEQNPYLGGVPTGTVTAGALPISLEDAVQRGLKQNLGVLLSSDTLVAAQGQRWETLSALLPNAVTATSLNAHQLDLKATIGLQIPGVPPVIGPFGVFDTRAYVDQSVFDWQSIERARSSNQQVNAAQYSYRNARDLVVLAVASSYLLTIADDARVTSSLGSAGHRKSPVPTDV